MTTPALLRRLERLERRAEQRRAMAEWQPQQLEEPFATYFGLQVVEALQDTGALPYSWPKGCPKQDPTEGPCYACRAWQEVAAGPNPLDPVVVSDEEACELVSQLDAALTAMNEFDPDGAPIEFGFQLHFVRSQ